MNSPSRLSLLECKGADSQLERRSFTCSSEWEGDHQPVLFVSVESVKFHTFAPHNYWVWLPVFSWSWISLHQFLRSGFPRILSAGGGPKSNQKWMLDQFDVVFERGIELLRRSAPKSVTDPPKFRLWIWNHEFAPPPPPPVFSARLCQRGGKHKEFHWCLSPPRQEPTIRGKYIWGWCCGKSCCLFRCRDRLHRNSQLVR